ncbi:protein FAM53B-like isoform X2 [Scleropages formosus]|nr:protein FAM53B-like isoform X2 [Scleropages formosus]
MSRGTALFSCSTVEADGWHNLSRSCGLQQEPASGGFDSLWGVLPTTCHRGRLWAGEVDSTSVPITSLIQGLSLSDPRATSSPVPASSTSPSAAPPSKRQCRSLSFSAWRPQGSRVWTAVEKRRCHSGGSAPRSSGGPSPGGGLPTMQRSSSFSLPARSNALPAGFELPSFSFSFTGTVDPVPRPLSLSHELIASPSEPCRPLAASSPESTPEFVRRQGPGGLARSHSQPCVLNDKKVGVKRRRPGQGKEQRPSLDLAKMTQKLRNFQSLSCPGFAGSGSYQSGRDLNSYGNAGPFETDFASACGLGAEPEQKTSKGGENMDDFSSEELDSDSTGSVGTTNGEDSDVTWQGSHDTKKDASQLGGELDIEQIERN